MKRIVALLIVFILIFSAVPVISFAEENLTSGLSETDMIKQFAGKKIGVTTGSIFDQYVTEYLPESTVVYINNSTDLAVALENGKIDGYLADEPIARALLKKYTKQYIYTMLEPSDYGYLYPKNNEKSDKIREEMNEYLRKIKSDGTFEEIDSIWFGDDETKKTVDYSVLTGENGTLNFAVTSDVGEPFVYVKDGIYVGYDVDIAVRFCAEYGYGISISDSNVAGFLASVVGGRCDFGGSTVNITEERKKTMDFSESNYSGGVVLVTRDRGSDDALVLSDKSVFERLRGCKIGVLVGSNFSYVEKLIPDYQIEFLNSTTDLALALDSGKVDAYFVDQPIARLLMSNYSDHNIFAVSSVDDYGYIFPKNSQQSDKLIAQINRFLEKIKEDGTIKEIASIWFGNDESLQVVDYSGLTGENGTLNFAISTVAGAPFSYIKNDEYCGYDIDIAVRFCREYGYNIKIFDSNFSGMLTGVSTGKYDFGASCITITEERKDTLKFSDPNYSGGTVFVIKGKTINSTYIDTESKFVKSVKNAVKDIKASFYNTFICESRWTLFVNGILVTVFITVVSVLIGTAFGFLLYLIYRKGFAVPNAIITVISDICEKTPVVVILMILYYVIFNKSTLDGIWVSVFGFSLLFACSVNGMLKVAVSGVNKNQMEAALALGYSDTFAFIKIILPQAIRQFMPIYKTEIVSLLKNTAIVGYIAVQDLTKISDIIRSRTFEAFFPLIASAVIYYAAAWIFTLIIMRIQKYESKHKRKIKIGADKND